MELVANLNEYWRFLRLKEPKGSFEDSIIPLLRLIGHNKRDYLEDCDESKKCDCLH